MAMKYRIVIRAFTLRRDLPQAYVLAKILEHLGCETIIACTRNYQTVLKYWKPHAVINTVGKINNTSDVSPDTKVIVWPAEGARAPHSSDAVWLKELMPEGTVDKASLYILWGDYTRRAFLQYFPKELDEKIIVCGHPKLDLIKFKPKVECPRKSIGFLTKFPGLNFYNRKAPITLLMENPEGSKKVLHLQIDQFFLMMKVIEKLAEKKISSKISVRPHPLEAPEEYETLRKKYPDIIEIDNSFDFADWASRQKVILTPASSSFIDLTLLNVPVVSIDNILIKEHSIIEETQKKVVVTSLDGNSYKPQNFDELVEMASSDLKLIPEPPEMEKYNRDVYDWPSEGSAIKRTAEAIISYLDKCKDLKRTSPVFPKFALDAYDWLQFYKAKRLSGQHHENFNYKEGFHKIPDYLDKIVENIIANRPTL